MKYDKKSGKCERPVERDFENSESAMPDLSQDAPKKQKSLCRRHLNEHQQIVLEREY